MGYRLSRIKVVPSLENLFLSLISENIRRKGALTAQFQRLDPSMPVKAISSRLVFSHFFWIWVAGAVGKPKHSSPQPLSATHLGESEDIQRPERER